MWSRSSARRSPWTTSTSRSGTTNTFPIWIYSIQRNALPVQINVIGSMIFLGAVGLVALSSYRLGRAARIR